MKRSEAIKKVRETENAIEVRRLEKLRQIEAEMDLENRESNRNRARSITVGTAFGGTTEIMMRSDGGRHIWCALQPVEVVELINQLAANVGCNVAVKPRDDFASWRDWRVSDAEKKHLNGHVPFVNDMAVFQQLGASGYNDEEAKKIIDILANVKSFSNENDDAKIILQATKADGAPNLMIGEKDGLLHNKVVLHNNEVIYMAGGDGGRPDLTESKDVAIKKTVNRRSSK
jgi:hypothetical protein